MLAACAGRPTALPSATPVSTPAAAPLDGTGWTLALLNGREPIAETLITLSFENGILLGSAGCNTYGGGPDSGAYQATLNGSLTITQTAITVVDCPEPPGVLEQEQDYMDALQAAAAYRMTESRLEILDASGITVLVFLRNN
jgi:heat shock protein HslJ